VLNWIWLGLILLSVLFAGFTGRMEAVSQAIFDEAANAVQLVIGLVGGMMLFLGLMNVAREGGLLDVVARGLHPLLRRLFPDVPAGHPAMGAMVMNIASNMLGLGNAATPFGLKAMKELESLNPRPGVATDPMVLFLAINTSAVTLMAPTGTMMIRHAAGSQDPAAIWIPTLIATLCSTTAAIGTYFLLRGRARYAPKALPDAPAPSPQPSEEEVDASLSPRDPLTGWQRGLVWALGAALLVALCVEWLRLLEEGTALDAFRTLASYWLVPLLVAFLLLVGVAGRVRVYESTVAGAKEGLEIGVRIVPYLLAILVAVGMFRASGALDLLVGSLDPLTSALGFPAEALPMALLRPLSGSGAFGVMAEIIETHGPDSFVGMLVSTLQGSTETTFYVLTVYCGAAGVRDLRHALPACLAGDVAGAVGATAACHLFFG